MQSSGMRTSLPQAQPGPSWIVLRVVSVFIKIVAILLLLGDLALGLLVLVAIANQATGINLQPGMETPPLVLGLISIVDIVGSLFLYAFADLILLFVAIEKNTRSRG
ncbi:hypothetical protein KSC_093780 [Ktedonobacter sp. SOSP1-52]|uniref:hypothetical protein n=1 Tax=Ktedonobacter sp. SOSP1-52 TaxID=2778366 RepID=UPI001915955D|nr:hypothetical protein [Ktedonobacter sp. SOSP1-52]GHO70486.1 hypothetical protein KSC_093780 [Ktedonobacter sp. SOSP1-52]